MDRIVVPLNVLVCLDHRVFDRPDGGHGTRFGAAAHIGSARAMSHRRRVALRSLSWSCCQRCANEWKWVETWCCRVLCVPWVQDRTLAWATASCMATALLTVTGTGETRPWTRGKGSVGLGSRGYKKPRKLDGDLSGRNEAQHVLQRNPIANTRVFKESRNGDEPGQTGG